MGRTRKYATEEEAHEAKKQQMRENYQKRKAEKARAATPPIVEPPKPKGEDALRTSPKSKRTAKKDSIAEAVNQPPQAEYLKLTKEELLAKFGGLLDSI